MVRFALVIAAVACAAPKPTAEPAKPSVAHLFRKPTVDPWQTQPSESAPVSHEPGMIANHLRAEKACPKVTAPYFYSVEKAGKKSVILGTRHIGVGLAKMPGVVTDRLSAAKLAVLETPPDNDDPPPDKPGPSLADAVGADQWKHFEELVGHDAAEVAEHAKPSVAIAGLTGIYEDVTQTLDVEIEQFAQAHSIPIQGLETNEFQDKLLDKLLDLRMLKTTISQTKDRVELEDESRDDLASYCAGADHDPGMDANMKKQMRAAGYTENEIAALDDQMLYARNREWIPKLEKILAKGDVFVAVGSDHLIGPRGIIVLLGAKGFKTMRIAP
jgi:uncharacterized protein YbaP (TraB family)